MKVIRLSALASLLGAGALFVTPVFAQTAPAPSPVSSPAPGRPVKPATEEADETITLTPFEVSASSDSGYQATETLAGTRIRTELKDVGGALSVYTKEFLKDIGATDNATLLQFTTNAEVAGTRGTYTGLGNGTSVDESTILRSPAGAQRVRGLASADNTRDFFVTDIPWDSYIVDRVDIQRGPNAILFGLGSPAGIVNATTRNAEYRRFGNAEFRVGSYGTVRGSLDYNHVLIPKVLAFRLDALWSEEKYRQEPAFQKNERYYGTIRFDPRLFKNRSFETSVKVKFEHGDIDANRPRTVPPNDSITPWFRGVNATSLDGGAGKLSVNNGYEIGAAPATVSPWLTGIGDQQQPIWYMDGTTNQLQRIYGGYINTGARNNDGTVRGSGESLLGQRFSGTAFGMNSLSSYAINARLPNSQYGQYRTATLTDKSVFNFYENLIDGPTKSEFEKWDAYNVSVGQTGWDNRVALEINYDRQKYEQGGQALITNPTLNIDVLRNFQDLTANPNYGRPFVQGGPGGGNSYESDREYLRASLFGEVRTSDFLSKEGLLTKILGKHRFNGVYGDESYQTQTRRWQLYAHSQQWAGYWNRTSGLSSNITNDRPPIGILYLGSSLANASSASGANISGVSGPVQFPDGKIYYFDSTWNAPASVAYNAPWTVPTNLEPIFNTIAPPTGGFTQASNPANYVGWAGNFNETLLRSDNGTNTDLLTGSQKTKRRTKSYAGSWQGFLWKDSIVPTLGWRYDEVTSRGVSALPVPANRSILNLGGGGTNSYGLPKGPTPLQTNQSYSIFKDHSTSGGVVVHLNKLFANDRLPINVSLSYNKSRNFQITDTRRDIYGDVISNPTGATKDYGVLLSTKDGRYSMRAVKYETTLLKASTQSNIVGLVGNVVQQGLRFRNVYLYKLSNYPWDSREQNGDRNTWATAFVSGGRPVAANNAATPPAGSTLQTAAEATAMRDASIRAWNDIQKTLAPTGYFSFWGYTPTTAAALTDRSTYEATLVGINPSAQFQPDPSTVFAYTTPNPQPQGLTMTSDTTSKGYELEFTANPTKNWRISINASKTEAVRSNVGSDQLAAFIAYMDVQMAGAAGDMRQFSGGYSATNEVRQNWNNARANYTQLKLQENSAASELRKWRYNVVTNYSFREGMLKGAGIGGSYNWQDKVVIGYPVIPGTGAVANFDLTKPYFGPSEDSFGAWVNYERKLSEKIGWKIQLNVRNAFAKDRLIPISVQPDGVTVASARIGPAREWFITNTFTF
ncbi:MAG TPA: TonB-dependent receptor [Opitutaceae bacterium]|nr:TonB-dependent receptor [Opitutaceae bacterium]